MYGSSRICCEWEQNARDAGVQLFKELLKVLRRLKDQEDVARSSSGEGDSDGSDAALDGSDGACA